MILCVISYKALIEISREIFILYAFIDASSLVKSFMLLHSISGNTWKLMRVDDFMRDFP